MVMDSTGPEILPDNVEELGRPAKEILKQMQTFSDGDTANEAEWSRLQKEVVRNLIRLEEWAYGNNGAVTAFHSRLNTLERKQVEDGRRINDLYNRLPKKWAWLNWLRLKFGDIPPIIVIGGEKDEAKS